VGIVFQRFFCKISYFVGVGNQWLRVTVAKQNGMLNPSAADRPKVRGGSERFNSAMWKIAVDTVIAVNGIF